MKKYFKKNKYKIIAIVAFILIMIFAVLGMIKLLYPDSSVSFYGNRLEDAEKYKIENDRYSKINNLVKENKSVTEVKSYLTGRIVKVIVTVSKDTDHITSKALADKVLSLFSDEEKTYYDFEVLFKSSEESEIYPLIGYKNKNEVNFKWANS